MNMYHEKKRIESSRTNSNIFARRGKWLVRLGLWDLISTMMLFSQKYRLLLMIDWDDHLDDPDWLGQTMAGTFMRLTPEDKDAVRALYDIWLWFEKYVNMQALVHPEFNALCYLLDRRGNRVRNENGAVTVLRGLKGQTKQEALADLDCRYYEFKQWW